MKSMPNLFVHIGHSKTGTTTLQNHLFSRHQQISYLGRPYKNPIFEQEIRRLSYQDSSSYSFEGLRDLIENYRKGVSNKAIVISEEIFSSVQSNDRGLIAQRIKNVFSPCSILLIIRNQIDIIQSFYTFLGGVVLNLDRPTGKLVGFDRWLKREWRNRMYGYFSEINYWDLIQHYIDLFGLENVHILLFEDLVHNKNKFIGSLSELLNIEERKALKLLDQRHERRGPSHREFRYKQLKSKYLLGLEPEKYISLGKNLDSVVKKFMHEGPKPALDFGEYKKKLHTFFKAGNQELSKHFNLPLGDYGYPM